MSEWISVEQDLLIERLNDEVERLLEALEGVMRSYEHYYPERYYSDDNVAEAEDIIKEIKG